MKYVVTVVVMLLAVITAPAAASQQYEERGPGPGMQEEREQNLTPEQFKERKARVLQFIEDRRKRLDQEKICIEASKNIEEMRKCRPEPRRQMGPEQGMPGGPGHERPPMGGRDDRR